MTVTELGSDFYLPPSRLAFLNKLQVLVKQNKIVAIEGPTGIGKTAVIEESLTSILPDANKCYITASRSINDIQVRSRIIEQLFGNVLFDPEKPLVASFLEFNQQTQLLIAIDNVHFLSGKIVGELLQLFSELKKAGINLVILLAFDKTLNNTLNSLQSSIVSVQAVPTLSKQESYQFLVEYFDEVPAQSSSRVKRWIDSAGGRPIQLLAFNQSTSLSLTEGSGLNIKLWGSVVVTVSILLALGLYLYRMGLLEQQQQAEVTTAVEQIKQQTVQQWPAKSNATAKLQDTMQAQEVASPEDIFEQIVTSPELMQPAQAERTDRHVLDTEKLPYSQQQYAGSALEDGVIEVNALLEEQEIEDIQGTSQIEPLSLESSEQDAMTEQGVAGTINQIVENRVSDGAVATSSEQYPLNQQESFYIIDNQTFLALPSDQYVLQLTAVSTEATLAKYLLSAPVSVDKMRIYKIKRNQKDWIVVTYGVYRSIAEARADALTIEPNAWAKSISVIQQQILNFERSQTLIEQ